MDSNRDQEKGLMVSENQLWINPRGKAEGQALTTIQCKMSGIPGS
jgi:hypothetical protein